MNDKNRVNQIKNNFNRASECYDQGSDIQEIVCLQALQMLMNHRQQFNQVVDFACGTGESTRLLLTKIAYHRCFAVDFAEKMLIEARKKLQNYKNLAFVLSCFEQPLFAKNSLSLIFTNMGLQWAGCLPKTLELFSSYLQSGGLMLFSLPIEGNFPEIKPDSKLILLHDEEIMHLLSKLDLLVLDRQTKSISQKFENKLSLLRSLKNLGTNYHQNYRTSAGLKTIRHIMYDLGCNQLTYKIGLYLVRK